MCSVKPRPLAGFLQGSEISPRPSIFGSKSLKEDQKPTAGVRKTLWIRRPGKLGANRP